MSEPKDKKPSNVLVEPAPLGKEQPPSPLASPFQQALERDADDLSSAESIFEARSEVRRMKPLRLRKRPQRRNQVAEIPGNLY